MTLPETPVLPTGRGESAQLPVLVDGVAEPVDARVATDGLVLGVDQDDLKELEDGVLSHPVGVEDTKSTTVSSSSLLQLWETIELSGQ